MVKTIDEELENFYEVLKGEAIIAKKCCGEPSVSVMLYLLKTYAGTMRRIKKAVKAKGVF